MKTSGKIIIADHQPEVTAPIHQVLQQVGYHAFEAHNEKDCLNLIFSHRPDVLLIDVHLPHGDGEEFCKQIKLNHDLPNLHIILMSEIDEEALKVDFNKPDYFDDLITKPIHAKELLLKLSMFELIKNMKAAFKKQKSSYEGILAGLSDLVINESCGRDDLRLEIERCRRGEIGYNT
jgi:DNA-binding response OmpR family regulator